MKHVILYSRFCPTKVVACKAKTCSSPNIWKDYRTKIFARLLSTQMISTATKRDTLSINMKSIKWKQAEPAFFISHDWLTFGLWQLRMRAASWRSEQSVILCQRGVAICTEESWWESRWYYSNEPRPRGTGLRGEPAWNDKLIVDP